MTAHLRPTATIAGDVLMPGDPGLALALAQELLAKPLMANHNHGLWGYSGSTETGLELTIQSSGIGGPSAVVVLGELAAHGARRAVRLGTALGLDSALLPGDALVVGSALGDDGTSRSLGATTASPDPSLTSALAALVGRPPQAVVSVDLLHDPATTERPPESGSNAGGAVAADLESAAVFALGARLDLRVGAALVVAETITGQTAGEMAGERDDPGCEAALLSLGRACAAALETTATGAHRSAVGR